MTDPLRDEEIKELRRLEQDATPAPWMYTTWAGGFRFDGPATLIRGGGVKKDGEPVKLVKHDDYDLAVSARNALPRLLDELERARRDDQESKEGYMDLLVKAEKICDERDALRAELASARAQLEVADAMADLLSDKEEVGFDVHNAIMAYRAARAPVCGPGEGR